MLNRKTIAWLAASIILGTAAAGPLQAQAQRNERPLGIYVDISYINLFSQPRWMALGAELEWRPARQFSLNPELGFWFADTFRGSIRIVPGLTANLRFNRLFLGGGLVWRAPEWDPDVNGRFVPKFQIGYLMGPARIALAMYVPGGIYDVALGLTIATRIGRPGGREPED
jgi:hypothetical protein